MAIEQTAYDIILRYQNQLCENLSDREWDLFKKVEHRELYQKIGFALYGSPIEKSENANASYTTKQEEKIKPIYDAILKYGSYDRVPGNIYMSTIFVFGEELKSKGSGTIYQSPVFRIRKCHKKMPPYDSYVQLHDAEIYGLSLNNVHQTYCAVFIDDEARVYNSWTHYLKNNRLPKCRMYVPTDGVYQAKVIDEENKTSEVMLDIRLSPACSILQRAANVADIVGGVGSVGGTVVCGLAAIPAVALAPAVVSGAITVGVGAGLYSAARGIQSLLNRAKHKQTIGLQNAEARGHWLNTVGAVSAGAAAGASRVIGTSIRNGATIGMGTRSLFNVANGANLVVNGSAVLNSMYVFKLKHENNEKITNLEIIQFTTSVLFFAHAAWNAQSANKFINETQSTVLMEYEANLSSGRKRQMFNKALKESERTKGVQTGRAEMIRGLRSITNHDEFFGTLVRSNKLFNENKARFTISPDGQIQINNNIFIGSSEFASMSVQSKRNYFATLPEYDIRASSAVRPQNTTNRINVTNNSSVTREIWLPLGRALGRLLVDPTVEKVVNEIFNYFEDDIRKILEDVTHYFSAKIKYLIGDIRLIFRHTDTILTIVQFTIKYLEEYARIYGTNQTFTFCGIEPDSVVRCVSNNKDKVDKLKFIIRSMDKVFVDEIIDSFRQWVKYLVKQYWNKYEKMKRQSAQSIEHDCSTCRGVYYTVV